MKLNYVGELSLLEVLYSRRGSCWRANHLSIFVVLKIVMGRNTKEWYLIIVYVIKKNFTLR